MRLEPDGAGTWLVLGRIFNPAGRVSEARQAHERLLA
jgi:cytochrome c-type biogenesis protein CcmH/NrfG